MNTVAPHQQDMALKVHTLPLGEMHNLVYVLEDPDTRQAAVIDPGWNTEAILAAVDDLEVTAILITHWHDDHTNAIDELVAVCDAPVHLLQAEIDFWKLDLNNLIGHQDEDSIRVGNFDIRILHTPGHSPGSACYYVDGALFTGDTLFVYGCGHCELAGADPHALYHSLERLLNHFPPDTLVYPGHDYADQQVTTLGEQQRLNPFLHQTSEAEFVRFRSEHNQHRQPPYQPVLRGEAPW